MVEHILLPRAVAPWWGRSMFLPTYTAGLFCGLRGHLLFQPSPGGRCPSAHTGADEGKGIETYLAYSEVIFHKALIFDCSTELVWSFPMAFPSSVTAMPCHLPPAGEGFDGCNCRSYNNHQGSALKRGNRGTPTPLQGQPHRVTTKTEQDCP